MFDSQPTLQVPPLPSGWEEVKDKKSDKVYFVNRITRQSRWTRPSPDAGQFLPLFTF